MIKYYCDVCREEIKEGEQNYVSETLEHSQEYKTGKVTINVMVGIDDVFSRGQLCKKCLIEVMRSFE